MKLYRLQRTQSLPISPEEAWPFFSSPLNLPRLTPPWLNLRVSGEIPDRMYPGMVIPYRVSPLAGLNVNWITEITHVDAPRYFVDEQRFGPYRFWQHQHHFQAVKDGLTMRDTVHYGLKFGPLGRLVHLLLVRRKLEAIFDYRQRALQCIFEETRVEGMPREGPWP